MTGSSDKDPEVKTDAQSEFDDLRSRIDQQSEHLTRHARELNQLHQDVEDLTGRIDAHQQGADM